MATLEEQVSTEVITRLRRLIAESSDDTYTDSDLKIRIAETATVDEFGQVPFYTEANSAAPPDKVVYDTWTPTWDLNRVAADIWEEKLENAGTSFEYTWSGFDKKEMDVLKTFRHMIPELVNNKIAQIKKQYPEIRKVGTDTALPENEFRQIFEKCLGLIEKENLKYVCFGHIGDCHLHINMIPENPEQFNAALQQVKSGKSYHHILDKYGLTDNRHYRK